MEPLGDALGRVLAQRRRGEPLEYLVELPPTAELEAQLETARARLGRALLRYAELTDGLDAGAGTPRPIRQADSDARRALELVKEGRRRDLLAAAFGCWCLGLGGRGPRESLYRPGLGFVDVVDAEGGRVAPLADYCQCPVGRALEAHHAPLVAAALERAADAARGVSWRNVPRDLRNVSLDTYELLELAPGQREALDLVRAWVPHRSRSLVLMGGVGVGKSGLGIAGARETGQRWQFVTVADLLARIRATYDVERGARDAVREADVLENAYTAELLILDDLGVQPATDWAATVVYETIAHRVAEQRRTIVTTNLEPGQIGATLGYQGERALSRLIGAATPFVLTVTGRDLRRTGGVP
jgi:DNA replication protein DnaC